MLFLMIGTVLLWSLVSLIAAVLFFVINGLNLFAAQGYSKTVRALSVTHKPQDAVDPSAGLNDVAKDILYKHFTKKPDGT